MSKRIPTRPGGSGGVPRYEDHPAHLVLLLDADDYRAVMEAMEARAALSCGIPDGGSNLCGRLVAKICRAWLEMLAAAKERRDAL